jgi:hypothetical protein
MADTSFKSVVKHPLCIPETQHWYKKVLCSVSTLTSELTLIQIKRAFENKKMPSETVKYMYYKEIINRVYESIYATNPVPAVRDSTISARPIEEPARNQQATAPNGTYLRQFVGLRCANPTYRANQVLAFRRLG